MSRPITDGLGDDPRRGVDVVAHGIEGPVLQDGYDGDVRSQVGRQLDRPALHRDEVDRQHPRRPGVVLGLVVQREDDGAPGSPRGRNMLRQPVVDLAVGDRPPGAAGPSSRRGAGGRGRGRRDSARTRLARVVALGVEVGAVERQGRAEVLLPRVERAVVGERGAEVEVARREWAGPVATGVGAADVVGVGRAPAWRPGALSGRAAEQDERATEAATAAPTRRRSRRAITMGRT